MISEVAEKRLRAIKEYTDLGSGVKVSKADLNIRGREASWARVSRATMRSWAMTFTARCLMMRSGAPRREGFP